MNYLNLIIIYSIFIFILHVIPTGPPGGNGLGLSSMTFLFIRADYLLHMLLFVPLMVLVRLYLDQQRIVGVTRFNHVLLWVLGGSFFAGLVEVIQYLLPYRSFNPVDVIFNVLGVLLGAIIFMWQPRKFARLKNK